MASEQSLCLNDGILPENVATFIVGNSDKQMTFKADKSVLTAASEVFKTMFNGSWHEISETIRIPDVEPEAFEYMLGYLNGKDVSFKTTELALSTLQVAHKYMLSQLQELSSWYVMSSITVEHACEILEFAQQYDSRRLKITAMLYICKHTKEVVSTRGFLNAQLQTVKQIVCQEYLSISEDKLISAIVTWAVEKCDKENQNETEIWQNVRRIIDPLMPHMRLKALTIDEFIVAFLQKKVLSDDEYASVLRNIAMPGSTALPPWCSRKGERQMLPESRTEHESRTLHKSNDLPMATNRFQIYIPNLRLHRPSNPLHIRTKFRVTTDCCVISSVVWQNHWNILKDPKIFPYNKKLLRKQHFERCSYRQAYKEDEDSVSRKCTILGELVVHNISNDLVTRYSIEADVAGEQKQTLNIPLSKPLLLFMNEICEITLHITDRKYSVVSDTMVEEETTGVVYSHDQAAHLEDMNSSHTIPTTSSCPMNSVRSITDMFPTYDCFVDYNVQTFMNNSGLGMLIDLSGHIFKEGIPSKYPGRKLIDFYYDNLEENHFNIIELLPLSYGELKYGEFQISPLDS